MNEPITQENTVFAKHVAKTYVWHKEKRFLVQTTERNAPPNIEPSRFNETIVWDVTEVRKKTTGIPPAIKIHQATDLAGSLSTHLCIVAALHRDGCVEEIER